MEQRQRFDYILVETTGAYIVITFVMMSISAVLIFPNSGIAWAHVITFNIGWQERWPTGMQA